MFIPIFIRASKPSGVDRNTITNILDRFYSDTLTEIKINK